MKMETILTKINDYRSIFGNVLHLNIKAPNLDVQVTISQTVDPSNKIVHERSHVNDILELKFCTTQFGDYDIVVEIWDGHNNREKYFYKYSIDIDAKKIDIETFNSSFVGKDIINDISTDVSSPAFYPINFNDFMNYVLYQNDVPEDLSQYFESDYQILEKARHYLTNKRYLLKTLNKNFILKDVTSSIPLDFIDNWVDVYALPVKDNIRKLLLRVYDGDFCENILIPYNKIKEHVSFNNDCIFVSLLDIYENIEAVENDELPEPYMLLTSTRTSIDVKKMFDLVWCYNDDGLEVPQKEYYKLNEFDHVESIYDSTEILYNRIPVNYDYKLYIKETIASTMFPNFLNFVSETNEEGYAIVKSLFPRLVNIEIANQYSDVSPYHLKMGDVILCRANDNLIVEEVDNVWEVRNSFNQELLFSTTDETLKYRIEDNLIYDIIFRFTIHGETHEIKKVSLVSSLEVSE